MKNKLKLDKFLGQVVVAGLIAWLGGLFSPAPARADVAPPPAPGVGGLEPFEYQDTEVQMMYERVEIELYQELRTDGPPEYLLTIEKTKVTAWFVMHNQGQIEEKMSVMFPIDSYGCRPSEPPFVHFRSDVEKDSFSVQIDGKPITTTWQITTEHPSFDENAQCEQMTWEVFDVAFPVDKDVLIRIDYTLDTGKEGDGLQMIEYILETGAAWKGPINRAYVIFRTPYLVNGENIRSATTPGYQILYHEVFWSYENLEPTHEDNISIVFLAPKTWEWLHSLKTKVEQDPSDVDSWLAMIGYIYRNMAFEHGYTDNEQQAHDEIYETVRKAILANPNSARLHAAYANLLWTDEFPYGAPEEDANLDRLLAEISKVLSLDPANEEANYILSEILTYFPEVTFTPPPTIPPTITLTPTITPASTITPIPSETPAPTDTRPPTYTRIPSYTPRPTRTATLRPTLTPSLTASSRPTATVPTATWPAVSPTPQPVPLRVAIPALGWMGGFLVLVLTFTIGIFLGRHWR